MLRRRLSKLYIFFSCFLLPLFPIAAAEDFAVLPAIDQTPYRLCISLIDFPTSTPENTFLLDSSGSRGTKTCPGLLSGYLVEDGYPLNQEGESMAALFSDAVQVNCFLPERADGWWLFDSTQCFVTLQRDRFVLYRELGTVEKQNSSTTLDHGQFLPFSTITSDVISDLHTNTYDALGNELPDDDPRKGERLYAIPANEANHYFGLTLDTAFTFPTQTDGGEDLIASFTADDDLWVYIDGFLILDLGGIHSAIPGSINFSTGAVTYRGADGKDYTTKLYKLFYNRYKGKYPEARERDVQAFLDDLFTENSHWQQVFKENTTHTIKLIYLERGAGASNLSIKMNLPILEKEAVE